MTEVEIKKTLHNWQQMVRLYLQPNSKKAVVQILNSFLPFAGIWAVMYFSLNWSYAITLLLAIVAAFFLVRIFIIQHDCGHRSFLKSRKYNILVGYFSSFFSTIPFKYWASVHNVHHAHNAQLEHRGMGDIVYLTTDEYGQLNWWKKFSYRFYRHPAVQFLLVPVIYLTISNRYPFINLKGWRKIRWSQVLNNLLIVALYALLMWALGWKQFLLVHVPIVFLFGVIAFWFFYVQHQHEENYKEQKSDWNHLLAAIQGSSYYKLPKVFQWLTGNIGLHHIHHLNPRIPNYHLERCAKDHPLLNKYVTTIGFRESLGLASKKLYHPPSGRMISFKEYKVLNS